LVKKSRFSELKKDRPIEVEWVDIIQHSGWEAEDKREKEEPAYCRTVGYFLNANQHVLRLSSTISDGERDVTVIPKGCIKKITDLERIVDEINTT